jgi:hypothetical protein
MSFYKIGKVESLATYDVDSEGHIRSAAQDSDSPNRSYYADGARKIDVNAILERAASKFDISADPKDYLFEAIRANTTNIPNENEDAFHREELLRFDRREGMPVYMSYTGKPHHVNHKTDNPKTARGVILDAHYNDDAPSIASCPGCASDTLDKRARDESGIHCLKCGATVKDEFVEILVAVDTRKDPVFAKGVRTGQLKAGSMGCNCARTQCNVCDHIAYSQPEFCEHIRGGNKGTLWAKSARGQWQRVEKRSAEHTLKRAGTKLSPDFCYAKVGGVEIRKAFERCQGVQFDEYSRVHQPADPKATSIEVLQATASASTSLETESELLLLKTRLAKLESKVAMKKTADEIPPGLPPMEADKTADEYSYETPEGEHIVVAPNPDGEGVVIGPEGVSSELPEDELAPSMGIDEYQEEQLPENSTGEELGLDLGGPSEPAPESIEDSPLPPPPTRRSPPVAPGMRQGARMFKSSYNKWTVEVTERGNARVIAPEGAVMLIRARQAKKTASKKDFGKEILSSLFDGGLVKTAKKYKALISPRFASITADPIGDMSIKRSEPTNPVSAGGDCDQKDGCPPAYSGQSATDGGESDGPERGTGDSVTEAGHADHDNRGDAATSALEGGITDGPEHKKVNVGKDTPLADPVNDRAASYIGRRVAAKSWANADAETLREESWLVTKRDASADMYTLRRGEDTCEIGNDDLQAAWIMLDKVALPTSKVEDRLKKIHAARIAKLEDQQNEAVEAGISKFIRALKLVAARQAINVEDAPLKESLGVALSNAREVGRDVRTGHSITYEAMPEDLAVHLIESAWKDGGDTHIDQLLSRAADLAGRSDEYLADAEADLSARQGSHRIATLTYKEQVSSEERRAARIREEALTGNLQLNTSSSVTTPVPSNGHNKSASIRGALSNTKAGLIKRQFQS